MKITKAMHENRKMIAIAIIILLVILIFIAVTITMAAYVPATVASDSSSNPITIVVPPERSN